MKFKKYDLVYVIGPVSGKRVKARITDWWCRTELQYEVEFIESEYGIRINVSEDMLEEVK